MKGRIYMMQNRVTIKTIKNNSYVYEWEYIPKDERLHENKKYQWTYKGPVSGKGGDYIKILTAQDEKEAAEYVYGKAYLTLLRMRMKELEKEKPFFDRLKEIDAMSKAEKKFAQKELRDDMEIEADKFVNEVLIAFSPESLWDYLRDGGTLEELIKKIKRSQR